MSSDLASWVSARLDADSVLSDDAKLLILAALEGKRALADMAGFEPPPPPSDSIDEVHPAGAFLKKIKVRGFRGIGPESHLDLDPCPSLTVISGRNGSGKSSFAEALELALTGKTYRWSTRTSQWRERWRNIHDGDQTAIEVTFAEEGVGATRLTVDWADDADLDSSTMSLQRQGQKKEAGSASLGWAGSLETYRPLLTYEELGALLAAEPKVLYDTISTVLGLEQLSEALKALDEYRKTVVAPELGLRRDKRDLVGLLEGVADERATRALALLKASKLDTELLRNLATGTTKQGGVGAQVHAILNLALPSQAECEIAAHELAEATSHLADVGDRLGDALQRRSDLLAAAISLNEHEGDQVCPVCAVGTLDAARSATLRTELERDREILSELQAARVRQSSSVTTARTLLIPPPPVLAAVTPEILNELVRQLNVAWAEWHAAPTDAPSLAKHISTKCDPARRALAALKLAAEKYLNGLDEAWSKVAARLAGYANAAEEWAAQSEAAATATAAHKWLKENSIVLKNERVQPIADEARHIWASLRQESNVEIAGLTLESSNTRRRVVIAAEVDGEDAGALAVMSQGELHSLALALFLPRATMPESPFRFVVLDDPVQAMDPSKVDGLVKVLLEIAKSRQVLVFSHDDRFASAVRRSPREVPIKVLELVREVSSKVTAAVTYSPADRYLRDAFGLVKDDGLPDDTRRRVLPGLLRMAIEAQAREIFFVRELSGGASHLDVETAWENNPRTRDRLALALGDPSRINIWLERANYRKWALRKSNSVHFKLEHGDPIDACRDVEKTLADLRNGVK